MRALTRTEYGSADVLSLVQTDEPTAAAGEVRVRVHAISVTIGDVFMVEGAPYLARLAWGLSRPKQPILGLVCAGVVDQVGSGVTDFQIGDEVFGEVYDSAFADYVAAPAKLFARKPASLSFEQAAAIPVAGPTALQALRDAGAVQSGDKVLINGGSGGVGTFAVQIAKALGAEVTAVVSTRNIEQTTRLGADRVVDYTQADFVADGPVYDVVLDLAGSRSLSECRSVLKPQGTYVCATGSGSRWFGPMARMLSVLVLNLFTRQRLTVISQAVGRTELEEVLAFVESGQIRPEIEQVYPADQAIEAMGAALGGHARSKKVIRWVD